MATSSSSSIGSSIISSLGIGLYDPKTIAEALANAETIGTKSAIESRQETQKNKLTAYTTVQNALLGLKAGLSSLASASSFSQKSINSSDSTAVGASISSSVGAGTYEIAVTERAKAHTLATQAFSSQTTPSFGSGTLTLSVGGSSKAITVDAGNNSLTGIKESINSANMGISASVVNDGSGYRLVLNSANSGASNVISMSITDDGDNIDSDNAGLSALKSGISTITPPQDAEFTVNGVELTSASNQVTGVIDGVTLNLNKKDATSTITIASDTSAVKDSVKSIVEDYNAMKSILDNYTSYTKDKEDPTKGILVGDSTISQLRYQMRNMLNFKSSDTTSPVQSMADIGVKTELDGSLTLDESALNTMLAESPNAVSKLFASVAEPSSPLVRFKNATDRTTAGEFTLKINQDANGVYQVAKQALYLGGAVAANPSLGSTNNSFQISVNGTISNTLTVNPAANADKTEIATYLQGLINNDSNLKAKNAQVSVSYNATDNRYEVLTDKYGSASKIVFSSVSGNLPSELGLSDGSGDTGSYNGKDVAGSLVDSSGKNFVFMGTGQAVKITQSEKIGTFLTGAPRDLEFDVLGNADGSTITVTKGYASGLSSKIDSMLDKTNGLLGSKITNITKSGTTLDNQLTKVNEKYDTLVQKYVYQFGMVNALQSQMTALSTSLKAMFQKTSSDS